MKLVGTVLVFAYTKLLYHITIFMYVVFLHSQKEIIVHFALLAIQMSEMVHHAGKGKTETLGTGKAKELAYGYMNTAKQ